MTGWKSAYLFVLQSIVVGLAVAFLVVLVRPDLLPTIGDGDDTAPASYADAVDLSAPAVVSVETKRLVEDDRSDAERTRFRIRSRHSPSGSRQLIGTCLIGSLKCRRSGA